ncbi:MAG TPA: NADH-dependent [FeFe] hydrogenase, group A6 [Armatimonadota bacterium]|jgi:iron-only hydrogenase group A
MINLTIDGKPVSVPEETTIMNAAETIGVKVPRLCYHPRLSIEGACRVCVVEVEGMRNLVTSCAYPVAEGMVVRTMTPEIREIRRDLVELLIDNHPMDCQTCERDGNCELQDLAYSMGVRERHFKGERKRYDIDDSSVAVIRVPEKCVMCHRCVRICGEIQGVHCLGYGHRGFKTVVMPAYNTPFAESVCITCGQCINVCPTAAFLEKDAVRDVLQALKDPEKHVVVQFAPSLRAAIGEGFGIMPGVPLQKKTVAALRLIGFDSVFDTEVGADITIMEEATEFVRRVKEGGKLPLITSCSSAWIKFIEHFYPEMLPHLSSTKSPMSMLGSLVKSYYAESKGLDPANIYSVGAMCCTAKKFEASRPQCWIDGTVPAVDSVMTTRELIWLIKNNGIDFLNLDDEEFDDPLGESTGAGSIFGWTGGLAEAVLRTAYYFLTGETLTDIEFEELRGFEPVKKTTINIGGRDYKFAVVHGAGSAHELLRAVKAGEEYYDFIEVMGCPGGCIGGGGQPYARETGSIPLDVELLKKRAEALRSEDRSKTIRRSYENPWVQRLYREYLGEPMSEKSHHLLHTTYVARDPKGIWREDVKP